MELIVAMAMITILLSSLHGHSIQQSRQIVGAFAEFKAGRLAQRELVLLRERPGTLCEGERALRFSQDMLGHLPGAQGAVRMSRLPDGLWSVEVELSWQTGARRRSVCLHSWIDGEQG